MNRLENETKVYVCLCTCLPIFDSFIHSKNYLDFYLEIKLYLKTIRNLDNLKKQILIHIISWFIQFHHIQEYKVNVLKYGMLINLPKNKKII